MSTTTILPPERDSARRAPAGNRSASKAACKHCGAPSPAGDFCCAGCAYVHRLVHEEGLDAYYRIKDEVTVPADPALLQPRDYAWLETAQREAEAASDPERAPRLLLEVQGISCVGCVWLIEKVFQKQPGAGRIEMNAQTGQMRIYWERGEGAAFDATAFARALQRFNYLVGPAGAATQPRRSESRALARRIGLCTAFAMNVMLFTLPVYFGMERTFAYAPLFGTLSMAFGTLSLLAGGGYFLNRAVRALREGAVHIDLPIALGIVGAYAGSMLGWLGGREEYVYFDFVSAFILLMLVGRWAQVVAVEGNRRRLLSRQPVSPRVRLLGADGSATEIAPEQLQAGQRFAVAMGHNVPVEGRLETAEAAVSLAWINGESEPRVFRAGQRVPAGAQNLTRGELQLTATQAWDGSLLAELLKPVAREGYRHRLLERVIQGYLVAVIGIAALAGLGWWLETGDGLRTGAVVTAILVVSCPCALGLAFPLADEIATVALRRRGVFVRAADLWPRLERVRKLVFDKTGTLTLEIPVLLNPEAVARLNDDEWSALLALVQDSAHPVGRALHESLLAGGRGAFPLAGEVCETVGSGVELDVWSLGRPGWRVRSKPSDNATQPESVHVIHDKLPGDEPVDVVLAWAGVEVARFHFADQARADARDEIAALGRRGLEAYILSGDRPAKVAALMDALGLPAERGQGGLSPGEKAGWLDTHDAGHALMLGDGANDSLAFDRALCRGTPVIHRGVLARKADFYYLGRGIAGIRALFEVNDARRRTQQTLLVFMVAYNLLAVGLSVSGHMNPLIAAILMPVSSLLTLALVGWGMRGVTAR
ncbi:MAG: HAD family hydrolase [Verrucomicrobia bacterium]|nr:HAD family hydrolase [Verrucomicrobiota bacterium]